MIKSDIKVCIQPEQVKQLKDKTIKWLAWLLVVAIAIITIMGFIMAIMAQEIIERGYTIDATYTQFMQEREARVTCEIENY